MDDLYRDEILEHYREPHNFGTLDAPDASHEGHNPLCGDRLTVFFRRSGETLTEVCFQGSGCAISVASASMMTEAVSGHTAEEVVRKFDDFHALVTGKLDRETAPERLGKLAVFSGVGEFPVRVKCATLPWHTLRAALADQKQPVSSE